MHSNLARQMRLGAATLRLTTPCPWLPSKPLHPCPASVIMLPSWEQEMQQERLTGKALRPGLFCTMSCMLHTSQMCGTA